MYWITFVISAINVLLALAVIAANPRRPLNLSGGVFFAIVAIWNVTNGLAIPEMQLVPVRLTYLTGTLMVSAALVFTWFFARGSVPRRRLVVLAAFAVPVALVSGLSPWVVTDGVLWGFTPGPLMAPLAIWLLVQLVWIGAELLLAYRAAGARRRLQIRVLLIGSGLFAAGGTLGSIVLPLANWQSWRWIDSASTIFVTGSYCYVILRYQFLDIRPFLARVFSGSPHLLEALNEGFGVLDGEGNISFANQRMADLLGYSAAELQGQAIRSFLSSESIPTAQALAARYRASHKEGTIGVDELELVAKDGTRIYAQVTTSPLYDENDQYQGVVAGVMDIGERRRAEQALRDSEKKYRTLVQGQGLGIGALDLTGRFLFANPAGHDIFGVPPSTLIGRNLAEFTEERALLDALAQDVRPPGGQPSHYEMTIRRESGETRFVVLTATIELDDAGRPASALTIFRDETERRRLETKMQQSQKLESLGVLAGGIAHDFNNLLGVIMGNASFAQRFSAETALRESLEDIERAAARAAELTRQMLAYAGSGSYRPERIDLSEAVGEMETFLTSSISKRVRLELRCGPGLPSIEVDRSQLQQVVVNLVMNASEAMDEKGGVVTVATRALDCDRAQLADCVLGDDVALGRYVVLEVADAGTGMSPEVLPKIFDPFFTTKFVGRGLGLAAVHGIVRSLRGAIQVSSDPGRGSTFRVLFPAVERGGQELLLDRGKVRTVLVVDDEEPIGTMCRRILSARGYEVQVARTGRDCVELVKRDVQAFDPRAPARGRGAGHQPEQPDPRSRR